MIEPKDKELILELQKNGRASYSELGMKIGLSPTTVGKRIKKLIDEEIIAIRAVRNPVLIGLKANAMLAIKIDTKKADNIYYQLSANFHVDNIRSVYGRFDIVIGLAFFEWEDLHRFINQELFFIDGVLDAQIYYIKEFYKRFAGIYKECNEEVMPSSLKEIDYRIIEVMIDNGRISINELAKQLNQHESFISKRLSYLQKKEIVKIVGIPNPEKLGFSSSATLIVNIDPSQVDAICQKFAQYPEISTIIKLIKVNNIIIAIHSKDNVSLHEFIFNNISQLEGVYHTETFIRGKIIKKLYGFYLE